jgi:long-subunit fatty acid transport protein
MNDISQALEEWVGRFQYTNIPAHEDVVIGSGMSAKFRSLSNNGYNISITRVGNGSILRFMEVNGNSINGVFAEFDDNHEQNTNWDFRLANFSDSRLVEYREYTNGMVLGKFLMWNPINGRLTLEAEFKQPYDLQKHRTDLHVTLNE